MNYVPPDGPVPNDIAICGESPGAEEIKQGRGFCGPSGKLLWGGEYDLIGGIVGRPRESCYVTNVCKEPMDEYQWKQLTYHQREDNYHRPLRNELLKVNPKVVLAFGRRACMALCPMFTSITQDQGVPRQGEGVGYIVMPLWHPSAYLRGTQRALTDIMVALAMVPELLANGLAKEPELAVQGHLPTTDDMLDYWPSNILFLTKTKVHKASCKLCGVKGECGVYAGLTLKWNLCRTHAIVTEQWASENKLAVKALAEHNEVEERRAKDKKLERAADRVQKALNEGVANG